LYNLHQIRPVHGPLEPALNAGIYKGVQPHLGYQARAAGRHLPRKLGEDAHRQGIRLYQPILDQFGEGAHLNGCYTDHLLLHPRC